MRSVLYIALADATDSIVRKHTEKRHFLYMNSTECSLNPGLGMDQAPADGSGADGTVAGVSVNAAIFKDGFWAVGCKTDAMYDQGDKYGDGAQRFEVGLTFNTSIVRYDVVHDRETQKPMTPQVCFYFCRTVEGMGFFGLTEGRTCYCEAFYKQKPGDGVCDLPCEGDSATICGGKTKSSLYQMHECEGQFATKWSDFTDSMDDFEDALDHQEDASDTAQDYMEDAAQDMEDNGIAEGSTSKLVQHLMGNSAKHARDDQVMSEAEDKLDDMIDSFEDLNLDPTDGTAEARTEGEAFIRKVRAWMKETQKVINAAAANSEEALPRKIWGEKNDDYPFDYPPLTQTGVDAFKTYRAIVEDKDSVCGGDFTGEPKAQLQSIEQCAWACDLEAPKGSDDHCIGFQYLDGSEQSGDMGSDTVCVLFKKITELTTYKCDDFEAYEGEDSFTGRRRTSGGWRLSSEDEFMSGARRRRRRTVVTRYANDFDGIGPRCYVRHVDFLPDINKVVEAATPIDRCFNSDAVLVATDSQHNQTDASPAPVVRKHAKSKEEKAERKKEEKHMSAARRLRKLAH